MDTIANSHREITKDYGNSVIKNVWVDSSEPKQKLSIESTRAIKGSMLETFANRTRFYNMPLHTIFRP